MDNGNDMSVQKYRRLYWLVRRIELHSASLRWISAVHQTDQRSISIGNTQNILVVLLLSYSVVEVEMRNCSMKDSLKRITAPSALSAYVMCENQTSEFTFALTVIPSNTGLHNLQLSASDIMSIYFSFIVNYRMVSHLDLQLFNFWVHFTAAQTLTSDTMRLHKQQSQYGHNGVFCIFWDSSAVIVWYNYIIFWFFSDP